MKKVLVVIDMQNDFIDGALGTEEAKKIVDLFSLLILASGKNLIEQLGKKITKTLFIFFRLHSLNGYSVSSGRMNNYGF